MVSDFNSKYCVLKSRAIINETAYRKGDIVELSDTDALPLIDENIIAAAVDVKIPSKADEMFAELKKEIAALKKKVEQQKGVITGLTEQLKGKNNQISNLTAKKK